MSADQIVNVVTSLLQGGGIAVFLYFLIRGLRQEIRSLNKTVGAQKETLAVMETRIAETEKVGAIYKGWGDVHKIIS